VKKTIQDKIDDIKKRAEASNEDYSINKKKSSISVQDSLSKAITNKKDADLFLAELEAAIKIAQEK
jgi:hypothetical protein